MGFVYCLRFWVLKGVGFGVCLGLGFVYVRLRVCALFRVYGLAFVWGLFRVYGLGFV